MPTRVNVTVFLQNYQEQAIVFEEKGQIVPKHRGGLCYPNLQDEHIQWLV
jgi:hypothetical protein